MSPLRFLFLVPGVFLSLTSLTIAQDATSPTSNSAVNSTSSDPAPRPTLAPSGKIPPADLTNIEGSPEPDAARMNKYQATCQQAQTGKFDLIFDGDSITDFWQTRGKTLWEQLYLPLHAIDIGIYGDRVQHVLWRLHQGELDGQDPKLVMLMIGTNNAGTETPEQIAEGIKVLLGEYKKRCPHAHFLLLATFPRNNRPDSPVRQAINQFNSIISKLDDGQTVTFLDINSHFLNADGTHIKELYMPDGIHPSPKGYEVWARAIQPVIDQYFPKSVQTAY